MGTMTRTFGLNARRGLESLKNTAEMLRADTLDEDLALVFSNKAWHLCDHVFEALASNSQFSKLQDLQAHVRNHCPELAYLQDICTESKHAKINRYEPSVESATHHKGDFCLKDFDSRDFDTSRLEIKLYNGLTIPYIDAVNRAVDFWSKFFEEYELR